MLRRRSQKVAQKAELKAKPSDTLTASSDAHFKLVTKVATLMVLVCFVAENVSSTSYGRFGGDAMVQISPRIGWWLLELPVSISFVYFFFIKGGSQSQEFVPRLLSGVMVLHYAYRGWIFPYMVKVHGNSSNFSIVPALGGSLVTSLHGKYGFVL